MGREDLVYMRTFAAAYPDSIAQQAAAQLPWRHVMVLLDKVADPETRDWYAEQDLRQGWSSAVLAHHIATQRHARIGTAISTFPRTMTPTETDQTREFLQDPYVLDFLALRRHHTERDLEDAIVARLTRFLSEVGIGFAFVGRQHKLSVGNTDYFYDLLLLPPAAAALRRVRVEGRRRRTKHVGKLNFYVNVNVNVNVNVEQLRDLEHGDQPTIGILLVADRDDVVVEYALHGLTTPLAVSTYRVLPEKPSPPYPQLPTSRTWFVLPDKNSPVAPNPELTAALKPRCP